MANRDNERVVGGSFRDPSGFVFVRDGTHYRQVNLAYRERFEHLISSGLYRRLVDAGLLISHEKVGPEHRLTDDAYTVLRPAEIPFISYPFEWCFSQLKAAATLTLRIQRIALEHQMTLKDASAFNVQFLEGRAVFIDTLSFDLYEEGSPWIAYRQFCQHFVAPLALIRYRDGRLGTLARCHLDGIPLDLTSSLLPLRTRLTPSLLLHVHFHSKAARHFTGSNPPRGSVSRRGMLGLLDSLESTLARLVWNPDDGGWVTYYNDNSYTPEGLRHKKEMVAGLLDDHRPRTVWDLGANRGLFSRIASDRGIPTVSFDADAASVEQNYLEVVRNKETKLLPLIMDLANPTPDMGWDNQERASLTSRGPADTALALALIHHLAIANNVPFERLASFFARICCRLVIEFVPKDDPQVQRMLASRRDVFEGYTSADFERAFGATFEIRSAMRIRDSSRTLYCMERH